MNRPLRVLYIVYWGAAEPLGQSLVLPAVARLAEAGAAITLVTFEKPADLARRDPMASIRAGLDACGVGWVPLRYHKVPKVPATAYDLLQGAAHGVVEHLRIRPDVIHARTFVGGLIGYVLARLLRLRWIYHNEGFYPDEQVDSGVWAAGGRAHRIAKALERRMYERADGIIALSRRAQDVIDSLPAVRRKGTPTIVVPSCVDLDRFRPDPSRRPAPTGPLRLAYLGSIGGRYHFDQAARFAATVHREPGGASLRVLTRTDPVDVAAILRASGLPSEAWSMTALPHSAVPAELVEQHAGLHFLKPGIGTHGGSPTKIGEYWASGLPVVTTPGAGDVDQVIRSDRVGVILREDSEDEYLLGARALRDLLEDPDLPRRCRSAAESHYALGPTCERQMNLYRELVSVAAGQE